MLRVTPNALQVAVGGFAAIRPLARLEGPFIKPKLVVSNRSQDKCRRIVFFPWGMAGFQQPFVYGGVTQRYTCVPECWHDIHIDLNFAGEKDCYGLPFPFEVGASVLFAHPKAVVDGSRFLSGSGQG